MIFIIGGLKYDTEKMERVAEVQKWYRLTPSLTSKILENQAGGYVGRVEDCILWKSEKGRWLLTHEDRYGEAVDEAEARRLLQIYALDIYEKLYGQIEEA